MLDRFVTSRRRAEGSCTNGELRVESGKLQQWRMESDHGRTPTASPSSRAFSRERSVAVSEAIQY